MNSDIDREVNLIFDEAHFQGVMSVDEFIALEEKLCDCEGTCECVLQ